MSIIHIRHIKTVVENRFRPLINLSDLLHKPPSDREDSFLTRGLSAFAVVELSGADDRIAAKSVVDEYKDNGIDALYYHAPERICYIVQSKWSKKVVGSIDLGSVLKFTRGVHNFFRGNLRSFGPNMKARKVEIEEILGDIRNTFVLVIAYTGDKDLHADVKGAIDELIEKLNDTTELVSLRILKQSDLYNIIAQGALEETIKLQIMLKEFGVVREPFKAYYGYVDLKDVANWGKFGSHLTAKNLRGFKGSTDVNDGIINTIRTSPQNFWYFNNGITVAASKVTPQPLGSGTKDSQVFECDGASVVNGAQTVGSIVSAISSDTNGLQNARVLVRIISLEGCPETFEDDLTKATNSQNRIESKDFVAQDPEQARLHKELYLENEKRYSFRSGESHPTSSEGLIFEDAAVALACVHPDILYTVQAKREVSKLWEDIHQPPYTVLFNATTSARRMWNAVEIMRAVEAVLKKYQSESEGKAKLIATHGNRFVLHMVFRSLDPEMAENVNAKHHIIEEAVCTLLDRLIVATKQLYESSYPSNLFKNLTKCRELSKMVEKEPPRRKRTTKKGA